MLHKPGIFFALTVLILSFLFAGCGTATKEEVKLRDLDFTVLSAELITPQLKELIAPKQKEPFSFSYQDGDALYLCIGYGKQETGGYSIAINELYLTENQIKVETTLLGPSSKENITNTPSYPYIVIKTENLDKEVVFE